MGCSLALASLEDIFRISSCAFCMQIDLLFLAVLLDLDYMLKFYKQSYHISVLSHTLVKDVS